MLKLLAKIVLLMTLVSPAVGQEAPDVMIRTVTSEIIELIKTDKAIQAGDQKRIQEVVEGKILTHFDFNKMTASAVGREWRSASPEQKAQLAKEFQTLLVRSYANSLSQYKNQTIDVKPFKASPDPEVTVKSEVKQPGAKPVQIDYDLHKVAGAWKVFDVYVAGVSLIANYRDSFGQEIKTSGLDGLIKSLRDKNAARMADKK